MPYQNGTGIPAGAEPSPPEGANPPNVQKKAPNPLQSLMTELESPAPDCKAVSPQP
jgi:hypothetical protein